MQAAGVLRCRAKLAVLDLEHRIGIIAGQDAHLVVKERAADDSQMAFFEANPGAIAIWHAHAAKFNVLDQHVGVAHHPQRLAFCTVTVGDQERALADSLDRDPALRPHDGLLPVLPRHDLDGIAVARHAGRFLDASEMFPRTDDEGPAARRSARGFPFASLARRAFLPAGKRAVSILC
jgi:hypothetical protein